MGPLWRSESPTLEGLSGVPGRPPIVAFGSSPGRMDAGRNRDSALLVERARES